ncbi:MAG: hypothetical protein ACE5EO_09195 [Candidatus Krumholzibacteriia bacterium]
MPTSSFSSGIRCRFIQVQRMMQDSSRRARQNTARLHALLNVSRMMGC